ncbi:unnamed protein product, partial [Polarella glacialis]
VSIFVEIAASGDANIAAAVGKRYLLGLDGFQQNYLRAAKNLQLAADQNHPAAMALLGYMHCLGLGVVKNLDTAHAYFASSALQDDAMGHNGLGFIYFHGTSGVQQDHAAAYKHFNASAYGGSADGMFNLASLYLTGSGVTQSFQRSALWYTQALDRGHTPAAYTLAVMHLNGVGTVRNCKMAVDLLKKVCERGSWVSNKLREAHDLQREGRNEAAAWLFLRLAEAGHEVAQMNFAHLLDTGAAQFLQAPSAQNASGGNASLHQDEVRAAGRIHAQRHYELSAEQGNALAELRLGDFAYYGWGLSLDDGPEDLDDDLSEVSSELKLVRQEADLELAVAHYRRTAAMRITGQWM